MNSAVALDWMREMLWTALLAGAPVLLTVTVIGLGVAVLQAATQVNDAAVPFSAKVVGVFLALVLGGGFTLRQLKEFAELAFEAMARVTS